jgi:hypothetical protein
MAELGMRAAIEIEAVDSDVFEPDDLGGMVGQRFRGVPVIGPNQFMVVNETAAGVLRCFGG